MAESSASGNSSKSKSLLWMMVGFFAAVSLLMGGAILMLSRAMRTVSFSSGNDKNTIHTAGGSFRVQKQDQSAPGLPVYPRAALALPDASTAGTALKQSKVGMNVSTYHTEDLRDFVDTWYTQHLSPEFKRRTAGENPDPDIFKAAGITDDDVAFIAERGTQTRIVALSNGEGGTRIALVRVDRSPEPAPSSPNE